MDDDFEEDNYDPDEEAVEDGHNEDDDEDQIEQMFDARNQDVWQTAGVKKNECIRELVQYFGSMVKTVPMEYAIPDNRGRYKPEDLEYSKLLDSSKYVVRAKRALIKNENFDTRDFTIFIAKKNWTRSILRPLLELCAKNDSLLAMRCCGLALVLIKRLSDKAIKYLVKDTKKKPRRGGANSTEEKGGEGSDKEDSDDGLLGRVTNAKQQLSALLSFKEALCSEKCNEALTNCFKEFWEKEQEATNEDNKQGVAICFSYFRRILAIEANPLWSTPGEVAINKSVHNKYIIQLRQIMGVIPGVCSDILRGYHNDWLADIILILYYAMNNFDSKDLFTVWKSGSLIENFEDLNDDEEDEPTPTTADPVKREATKPKEVKPIVVPALLRASNTDPALKKGSLLGMLKKEKNSRDIAAASSISSDPSRFRGVYRQPLGKQTTVPAQQSAAAAPATTTTTGSFVGASGTVYGSTSIAAAAPAAPLPAVIAAAPDSPPAKSLNGAAQTARIVKNPFSLGEQAKASQVKVKNGKKNLAFMDVTGKDNITMHSNRLTDADSYKACVVVATLVNLVSNEISLKPLIKRVNEDLRRDEMRVTHDLESRYFEIIAKILNYNRLKLADQYKSFLDRSTIRTEPLEVWEPNLKNVMDALDRMSFSRVIGSIERNNKQGGKPEDIAIPMNLYKEMICYMRVLLESGLEGHHEIAVASLFRLFYTASNEKLDPLQKLLSSWKPNTFPKRHMNILVELVHETLKTLEAAQNRYKDSELAGGKKRPKPKGRREMDLEQYIIACISFDVNDYFKRIVQNNTIRMYTTLLANYSRNETNVNHYIFCFFQRMTSYKLEQQWKAPSPPLPVAVGSDVATTTPVNNLVSALNNGSAPYEEVHLGFMLFNIQSLLVFSTILNDSEIYTSPSYKYMEPLVRLIKALVRRFGEASRKNRMMFVEALFHQPRPMEFCCQLDSVYEAPSYNVRDTNQWKSGGRGGAGDRGRGGDSSEDSADSSEDDYGDEFDENNLTDQFAASVGDKVGTKKSSKDEKRAARKAEKQKLRELKILRKKQKKESRYGWSAEEDAVLKEQYALYAGTERVFHSIAESAEMRAIGKNRNVNHIMKRARELSLHMQFDVLSEEEEEEAQSDASSDGDKKGSDSDNDDDNEGVDEAGILKESAVKSQRSARKRSVNPEDLNKSVDFGSDEEDDAGRLAGDGNDSEMEQDVDLGSPSAATGAGVEGGASNTSTTTPETNSSSSGSARKKPRLAPKSLTTSAVESSKLGRAVWDNDDDDEDFIEKRRNALLKSRKEVESTTGTTKKLTAHKKKNALRSKISDDEDDKLFADSEVEDLPTTQASVGGATAAPAEAVIGNKLKKNVNRMMMIDSDDDEL